MAVLPGYTWIENPRSAGGTYATDGPSSILLHMTVSRALSASYVSRHPYPPHFWANVYTGDKWQTISPDRSAFALYQPSYGPWTNKKGYTLQTELVGVPEVNVETYTDAHCRWIAEHVVVPQARWLASIGKPVNLNQVDYHTDSSGSASASWPGRMSEAEWNSFNGLCQHSSVPDNDHWDCSVERLDLIAQYAREVMGETPQPDEEDDDMMRLVVQMGSPPGCLHGDGTYWAIDGVKAYPISNPYTVTVMQAHGVLMTLDQMKARGFTSQTDGMSIQIAYQVQPVLESYPDGK